MSQFKTNISAVVDEEISKENPPRGHRGELYPVTVSSQRDLQDTKTCVTCAHKVKGDNHQLFCGKVRHPVSGRPHHLCETQRVTFAMDPTLAQSTAEAHDLCGPGGDFWEAEPVNNTPWWKKLWPY